MADTTKLYQWKIYDHHIDRIPAQRGSDLQSKRYQFRNWAIFDVWSIRNTMYIRYATHYYAKIDLLTGNRSYLGSLSGKGLKFTSSYVIELGTAEGMRVYPKSLLDHSWSQKQPEEPYWDDCDIKYDIPKWPKRFPYHYTVLIILFHMLLVLILMIIILLDRSIIMTFLKM